MHKLWKDEENKLIKSGRKWAESPNEMPYRCAELFCECCGKSLGIHDIVCTNLQTNMFCFKCVQPYILFTPRHLTEDIEVCDDFGNSVRVKYTDHYYSEIVVFKECYFNKKGRFIKVKGKRYYLNHMPLPEPPKEG